MLIFSYVWVLFILAPLPPFHYFKVVLNSDSGLTPPSFSAKFNITVFFLTASLSHHHIICISGKYTVYKEYIFKELKVQLVSIRPTVTPLCPSQVFIILTIFQRIKSVSCMYNVFFHCLYFFGCSICHQLL